jgi:polar amino acid transport system permease protein
VDVGGPLRFVVLPERFARMVPALVNEGVTLIRTLPLVSAISLLKRLALAARTVWGVFRYWGNLAISAVCW